MPVATYRTKAQRDRVKARDILPTLTLQVQRGTYVLALLKVKAEARDLVVEASNQPGNAKLLRAIAFMLLDYMAEMPEAEIRLKQSLQGLRLYAKYKANRTYRRG